MTKNYPQNRKPKPSDEAKAKTQTPKPQRRGQATRRNPNYPPGGADSFVDDPRNWSRSIKSKIDRPYGFEDDDEDDDDEEDRSLDLLVRFVQNVFSKVSKRARRAVRSVLPVAIPTKLGGLSVNGVLVLAFLWVLKAFLEVMYTIFGVFGC
ncbi:protein SHORT HYPOCOTYL IN WHITE LIGHT 1-like [Rosa rugosa]|uniref:protein SHORT HYPOCOTYL IN WHITE LIGHT 1-like n=1 Tax=Rosa rugosa TaxID=74645 RepID=UPI002B4086D6|nr:protein SHORT HYPOCOTYL IN WHITE LIGHT 1-like [Rosa rugosa]